MVSFTVISTLIATGAALGINCRGSGGCQFNNASLKEVLTQVRQIQASGNGGHYYGPGGMYQFPTRQPTPSFKAST